MATELITRNPEHVAFSFTSTKEHKIDRDAKAKTG